MSLLLALVTAGAGAIEPLTFIDRVETADEIVRLADVTDLSALPVALRERAAATPVARMRFPEQTLSSRDVARRARASVPALAAWLPADADTPIQVRWTQTAAAAVEVASAPEPAIAAGDELTVRVQVGPVTVEREVRALQPARAGAEVFVRTAEGVVLRARMADEQ